MTLYSDLVRVPFSARLNWPAPGNALSALRAELIAAEVRILDFSESNATLVGLGAPEVALRLFLDPRNARYEPDPRGLASARQALCQAYQARPGRLPGMPDGTVDARDLFLCSSTSEAYSWLFKLLCNPGDAVLVPKPGYPLFDYLAGLEAVEARPYRLEYAHPIGWGIDLDSVEDALQAGRTRALVLINPNNPTGSYVLRPEREALVDLCARHGCAVIADEVFYDFPVELASDRHAAGSFVGEDRVLCFVLDGLSKRLGMPQMKLGWIVASGPERQLREAEERLEIIADAYLSAGTPVMNALPGLLALAPRFADHCRRRLTLNMAHLRSILEEPGSPHRVLTCQGGWTAIIESPRLRPEEELALGLLREEHLLTQPGYYFDMEREAFFTASLIQDPDVLSQASQAYVTHFDRLMQG